MSGLAKTQVIRPYIHFGNGKHIEVQSTVTRRQALTKLAMASSLFCLPGILRAQEKKPSPPSAHERLKEMQTSAGDILSVSDKRLSEHWPKNTVVYGSCLQSESAYMPRKSSEFTTRFTQPFRQGDQTYQTLDAAMRAQQSGWIDCRGNPQTPALPAVDSSKQGWHVSQNKKIDRYVLFITGEGSFMPIHNIRVEQELEAWHLFEEIEDYSFDTEFYEYLKESFPKLARRYQKALDGAKKEQLSQERKMGRDVTFMQKTLSKAFAMDMPVDNTLGPNTRMLRLVKPTPKKLKQTLQNWLGQIKNKNAEVLVYYTGHGTISERTKATKNVTAQGIDSCELWLKDDMAVSEKNLKLWFNQYLSGFKHVSFIADACHSGALIAQNNGSDFFKQRLSVCI